MWKPHPVTGNPKYLKIFLFNVRRDKRKRGILVLVGRRSCPTNTKIFLSRNHVLNKIILQEDYFNLNKQFHDNRKGIEIFACHPSPRYNTVYARFGICV